MVMNEAVQEIPSEAEAPEGIYLRDFFRANESEIRWLVESLIHEQVTRAIGRENIGRVTLIFEGSFLGDLTVYVEGPPDLKANVEAALRRPSPRVPL
jgi:hypothetical protein